MSGRVYAMMPMGPDERFAFIARRGPDFVQVKSASGADEVIVFAPGTDVAAFQVAVPAKREAEARRAAAYAIEDEIAEQVDRVHVALGPSSRETTLRSVYVTARETMDRWIGALKAAGLGHAKLVAETSVLPSDPVALDFGDRLLVCKDDKRFALDTGLPPDAVRAVLGTLQAEAPDDAPLVTLAKYAEAKAHLTDLKQGDYAVRRKSDIDLASWRLPAVLAAAAAIAWTAMTAYEARTLDLLSTQMETKARATFAAAYPGEAIPRNLRQAVREGAGAPAQSLEFRTAAALLYKGVQDIEGLGIRSLRYDRSAGVLRASMAYAAYGDELKLKSQLEASGLTVRIGDTRQDGALVTGDITLEQGQ